MTIDFGKDFRFGAATSAYQIEGAVADGGRQESIWDVFCRVPGAIANGEDGAVAVDHYHRYSEDVALLRELGLDTYRFSVSWPRVFNDGVVNATGMDFYSRLVDELLAHQITPWLTLYHWDLPAALPGGWTNRDTAHRFVDYAMAVHAKLADRVRIWTTLNEPWCASFLSYAGGHHAPGHTDPVEAIQAAHHLLLGHGWATQALREADPDAELGITLNFTPAIPASDSAADVDVARRLNGTNNRYFVEPIFTGHYPADVLDDLAAIWPDDLVRDGDLAAISTPIDLLGVNYYTTNQVAAPAPGAETVAVPSADITASNAVVVSRGLATTAMGWDIDPDGLRDLLLWLQAEYTGPAGVPMVITENGAAFDDQPDATGHVDDSADRLAYLRDHLAAAHAAIQQGADLRGYLAWSLLDNFEWAFGYDKRFGIVAVDSDLRRIPKASAWWFAEVARTRRIEA